MAKEHNYYENGLYASNNTEKTANSNIPLDWKQPSHFLHWLVQLIKNPAGAARQVAGADIKTSLILIAINLIAVLVASVIFVIIINIKYRLYLSWVNISLSGIIILALLLALVFDFGFSGLLFVSTSIIFKEKTTFSKMLALVAGKVTTDSIFLLTGSVFMLLGSFFFFIITTVGNILSVTTLIYVYNENSSLPSDKKIYSISIALAAIYIIMMVIIKAVPSLFIGNILNFTNIF
ncbi:MAG: hypothetical protein HFH68_11885 [Lachnospiraceae bacterium]|nr:hypothetical protein [Lachnospiraceae bacterium]